CPISSDGRGTLELLTDALPISEKVAFSDQFSCEMIRGSDFFSTVVKSRMRLASTTSTTSSSTTKATDDDVSGHKKKHPFEFVAINRQRYRRAAAEMTAAKLYF